MAVGSKAINNNALYPYKPLHFQRWGLYYLLWSEFQQARKNGWEWHTI